MTISEGSTLPDATLHVMGPNGVEAVSMASKLKGRKVAIFGLPGAFTGTCSIAHVPSFIRTAKGFAEKGVDEIICISVNDAYVMGAWGTSTGAAAAGITMLGDPASEFTKAIGMDYDNPASGFIDRSKRFSLYAEDGVVKVFHPETGKGTCDISGGEALLEAI